MLVPTRSSCHPCCLRPFSFRTAWRHNKRQHHRVQYHSPLDVSTCEYPLSYVFFFCFSASKCCIYVAYISVFWLCSWWGGGVWDFAEGVVFGGVVFSINNTVPLSFDAYYPNQYLSAFIIPGIQAYSSANTTTQTQSSSDHPIQSQ